MFSYQQNRSSSLKWVGMLCDCTVHELLLNEPLVFNKAANKNAHTVYWTMGRAWRHPPPHPTTIIHGRFKQKKQKNKFKIGQTFALSYSGYVINSMDLLVVRLGKVHPIALEITNSYRTETGLLSYQWSVGIITNPHRRRTETTDQWKQLAAIFPSDVHHSKNVRV